jgi:hypothetical protein
MKISPQEVAECSDDDELFVLDVRNVEDVSALGTARWSGGPVGEVLSHAGASLDEECWVTAIGDDATRVESANRKIELEWRKSDVSKCE